jgi:uncharacterized protein
MKQLLFFTKYPEPGKVKTRLAHTVGAALAAHMYRDLVEKNVLVLKSLVPDGISTTIAYDPPEKREEMRTWLSPSSFSYLCQKGEGLTERLEHAFEYVFKQGAEHVLAIGSDTLDLTQEIILEAFSKLESHDVVIGPAKDGGYYLIGLNEARPELFQGISWSTPTVLASTLRIVDAKKLRYCQLGELEDLDDARQVPKRKDFKHDRIND